MIDVPCMSCGHGRNYPAPDGCLHKANHYHPCEVPAPPTSLSEEWTCPECGKQWRAFSVKDENPNLFERFRRTRPPGVDVKELLAWTTRKKDQ